MRARRWATRLVVAALVAVIIGAIGWTAAWKAQGGRWEVVRTSSMGAAAPVGTLLWINPVSYDHIEVGDILTFHPPKAPHETYTHRVVARHADGTLSTKGDNNDKRDTWRLGRRDVVGRVTMRWWAMGWVVKAAPILAIGGLLLFLLTRYFTAPKWRGPARILGTATLLALSVFVTKPLFGAQQVTFVPKKKGAIATYVGTGVFPARLDAPGGRHVELPAGRKASMRVTKQDANGRLAVDVRATIPPLWIALGVLGCLSPILWSLAIGLRDPLDPAVPQALASSSNP